MKMDKTKLRRNLKHSRTNIIKSKKIKLDEIICNNLLKFIKQQADMQQLFSYASYNSEIDLWSINNNSSFVLSLPKVDPIASEMEFYRYNSTMELRENKYGIQEISDSKLVSTLSDNTVVVVPALAVTKAGNRLGYGGGYYDKYFTKYKSYQALLVAVVYEQYILDDLPQQDWDLKLDYIITEKSVYCCNVKR